MFTQQQGVTNNVYLFQHNLACWKNRTGRMFLVKLQQTMVKTLKVSVMPVTAVVTLSHSVTHLRRYQIWHSTPDVCQLTEADPVF